MDLKDKKVAVLGFGLEGRSAAEFALAEEAQSIVIYDKKNEEEMDKDAVAALSKENVEFKFGDQALNEQFDVVLRSPGFPLNSQQMKAARASGAVITSGTAIFLERFQGLVVGVTGTKGKGTTSSLIHEMLHFSGKKAVLIGNIGLPALSMLPKIDKETIVVYELSSFQLLEINRSPQISVVLMVTQDHLDFHGSQDEYHNAKQNIVRFQNPEDSVVANIDYDATRKIAGSSKAKHYWTSRYQEVPLGCFVRENSVMVRGENREEEVVQINEIGIQGAHNLENVCAAVMAGYLLDLPLDSIRSAVMSFHGLPHRLQLAGDKDGVKYFDDSISTTPDSAIAAIKAFPENKIVILGGSPKGADFSALGKIISTDSSVSGILGLGEEWSNIKKHIDLKRKGLIVKEGFKNMEEVVLSAKEIAKAGDVVILSPGCASFGMFKNYKERGEKFVEAVEKI